jgi:hypothetical protein
MLVHSYPYSGSPSYSTHEIETVAAIVIAIMKLMISFAS